MKQLHFEEKEFNLSEKIDGYFGSELLNVGDVKEFIKRLKEALNTGKNPLGDFPIEMVDLIDKLAGEDLV